MSVQLACVYTCETHIGMQRNILKAKDLNVPSPNGPQNKRAFVTPYFHVLSAHSFQTIEITLAYHVWMGNKEINTRITGESDVLYCVSMQDSL